MSTGDGYYQHGKCCFCKCNCEPKTFGPLPKQPQSSEHIKQLSEAITRVLETGKPEILTTSPISKQWVGLSDDDRSELSREMVKSGKSVNWLSNQIEAKLKELNHE